MCVLVCGWPDCYIHSSGSLLANALALLEAVRRQSGKVGGVSCRFRGDGSLTGSFPAFPVISLGSSLSDRGWKPRHYGSAGTKSPSSLHFFFFKSLCYNAIVHRSPIIWIYTSIKSCFQSMWSYGEDVDLTLYLGHRSLCMGCYAFAHNSM